jgi:WD40 repeat protein
LGGIREGIVQFERMGGETRFIVRADWTSWMCKYAIVSDSPILIAILILNRWSQEGEYLVSGSDDHRLFIWSAYDKFAVRKVLDTGSIAEHGETKS